MKGLLGMTAIRSGFVRTVPPAGGEIDVETVAVFKDAAVAFKGNGEDDGLGIRQVWIHPSVAHIEISCLLRAFHGEDGCGLRAEGLVVTDVCQRAPAFSQVFGMGNLALVGSPSRAGG